jgi:hypothetical protein
MNQAASKERRRHVRVELAAVARLHWPDGDENYQTLNVSAGGIFLLAARLPEEESEVDLDLFLPQVQTPVKAKGEVVWLRRQAPSGFAIKFIEISVAAVELIRLLVQRAQHRSEERQE